MKKIALAAVLSLVFAACGGGESDTTAAAGTATSSTVGATSSTTSTTTTTTTSSTTSTSTTTTTTTTTPAAPAASGSALVDAKMVATLAAVPTGWTSAVTDALVELDEDNDVVFGPCLGPDDFDLDDLDSSSAAAAEAEIDGPANAGPFGGPTASIEARVFSSEEVAEDAFAVLEKVLGTQEGRLCMADQFITQFGQEAELGDLTIGLTEIDIEGASVAVRLEVGFTVQGIAGAFFIDLAAARDGDCTVFALFLFIGAPFPDDVADELFSAATGA